MKRLAIWFSVAVFVLVAICIVVATQQNKADYLALGNFVVLTLTLLVLVWYAYDTNAMARIATERWTREGVLGTVYSLELVGVKGDVGRTLVRIHNPSTLVVRAKLTCNFRVYGESVAGGPLYDGNDLWVVFPQQLSQGWFEIEMLLQKKGKSVAAVVTETTPANRVTQLTMDLAIEFHDELGMHRTLPTRPYYFDFERWAWIPRLGESN